MAAWHRKDRTKRDRRRGGRDLTSLAMQRMMGRVMVTDSKDGWDIDVVYWDFHHCRSLYQAAKNALNRFEARFEDQLRVSPWSRRCHDAIEKVFRLTTNTTTPGGRCRYRRCIQ
jgi:hypothetical protein